MRARDCPHPGTCGSSAGRRRVAGFLTVRPGSQWEPRGASAALIGVDPGRSIWSARYCGDWRCWRGGSPVPLNKSTKPPPIWRLGGGVADPPAAALDLSGIDLRCETCAAAGTAAKMPRRASGRVWRDIDVLEHDQPWIGPIPAPWYDQTTRTDHLANGTPRGLIFAAIQIPFVMLRFILPQDAWLILRSAALRDS